MGGPGLVGINQLGDAGVTRTDAKFNENWFSWSAVMNVWRKLTTIQVGIGATVAIAFLLLVAGAARAEEPYRTRVQASYLYEGFGGVRNSDEKVVYGAAPEYDAKASVGSIYREILPGVEGFYTNTATAEASLASVSLKSGSFSSVRGAARSDAYLQEKLHFTVTGVNEFDVTPFVIMLRFHGEYDTPCNSVTEDGCISSAYAESGMSYRLGNASFDRFERHFYPNEIDGTGPIVSMSSSFQSIEVLPDSYYKLVYNLAGTESDLQLVMGLGSYADGGSSANLLNTASIYFILPQNVSFRSDSGIFGSAWAQTAVPEPATWALMILGFGGVGAALRRRRLPVAV